MLVSFLLQRNMSNNLKLSKFFWEKAKLELGEDETTKKQGIEYMRAWIKSQPNIRKCQQGKRAIG